VSSVELCNALSAAGGSAAKGDELSIDVTLLIPQTPADRTPADRTPADQTPEHEVPDRTPLNRTDRYSARSACAGSGEQATEPGISVPLRERDQYKNSVAQFNALPVRDGSSVEEVWLSTDVNLTFDITIHVNSIIHPFPLLPLTGVAWPYRQLNNRTGQDRCRCVCACGWGV